ncbi:unnamed protein product [Vitrella brassicaformis CCMP3155]|uniref:Importin subunit alpha n=1 Tax=Vitrella brassicaformis (strain CCMP3155) TaxID=1169540 RepID=A0A0G4GHL1_VITBC|nr:unnamed protein product [Vitrella brassicaformis CCMP3155]|eukprot:CEM29119.1 unnamed protein product [Vitrella brassicaformis CCMP3155]
MRAARSSRGIIQQRPARHQCDEMDSAAVRTPAGQPSLQAVLERVLDEASTLLDAIRTQEAYDRAVQQRGLESVEADIAAVIAPVVADIRNLMASASDPQLRIGAICDLIGLLSIEHIEGIGQKAVDIGVVPLLVEQLSGCEDLQAAAGQALSMLAIQNGDAVANADAVPPLVQLVSSHTDRVCVWAIMALCHVMSGLAARRDVVVAAGIVEPLLKVMRETSNVDVLKGSALLLRNLWIVPENAPLPAAVAELAPFVPVVVGLIAAPEQDDHVLRGARGALAHFGSSFVGRDGTDADRDALMEHGAVPSIRTLLETGELGAHEVAASILRFMTAGTTSHVQALIDGGLVPLLVDVAANAESDPGLKELAAGNIGSIAREGSQQQVRKLTIEQPHAQVSVQIEYVVECGGIQPLCDLLDGDDSNREVTISTLDKILGAGEQKQANEGLPDNPYSTIFEQAGGVDKVAALQTHNDVGIAIQALVFLISHFPTRVDAQRLEAIIQEGVIQVVQADEVETNVGADDDIGSDGEADGDVDGQLEGDGGDEGAEG